MEDQYQEVEYVEEDCYDAPVINRSVLDDAQANVVGTNDFLSFI